MKTVNLTQIKLFTSEEDEVREVVNLAALARDRVPNPYAKFYAEQLREDAAYRQRDVLERLKELQRIGDNKVDAARKDAIDEIEWLRSARPENSVTRQELNDITAPLREAQATISALLLQLENK
jgi:membrane peptidoglycan carboxypeptidase